MSTRTSNRVVAIIAVVIAAIGIAAAVHLATVGQHSTSKIVATATHRAPTQQELNELKHAQKINAGHYDCRLEWDAPVRDQYEAVCTINQRNLPADCVKVPAADQSACLQLDYRTAARRVNSDGTVTLDPAGPALVAECVEQYKGVELSSCLNQPEL